VVITIDLDDAALVRPIKIHNEWAPQNGRLELVIPSAPIGPRLVRQGRFYCLLAIAVVAWTTTKDWIRLTRAADWADVLSIWVCDVRKPSQISQLARQGQADGWNPINIG